MTPFRNSIIHADCLKALPMLPDNSVHFILTDPPYLVNYKPRDGRKVSNDNNAAWLKPAFTQMYRVLARDGYCFTIYGWPHADRFMAAFRAAGFRPVGHFSLLKRYNSSAGHVRCQHECAYLLAKGNPGKPTNPLADVIEWGDNTGNRHHPTEKSVSALRRSLKPTQPKQARSWIRLRCRVHRSWPRGCSAEITSESRWMRSITL